jgi:biopolymer transport protein ExbD
MMRRRRIEPEDPVINLTPLIDVVFVILIGFILVAPLLDHDEVELAGKPQGSASQQEPLKDGPIQIRILADDSIWVKGQQVDRSQLGLLLARLYDAHPHEAPMLIQDRRGTFGIYQEVKNACENAGFRSLDVVLKPQS